MKRFLLLLVLTASSAFADTYFVGPTHTSGAGKEEGETVHELLEAALATAHQQVTETEKASQFVLKTRLLKLGEARILTLEKLQHGKQVASAQLKAENLEELDAVTGRLVRAIVGGQAEAQVSDVTSHEATSGSLRRPTVNRWYFGLGPAMVSSVNTSNMLADFAIGYNMEIDPDWALKILLDGSKDFGGLSLGANYYLSQRDTSPVLMGTFGYGSATIDSDRQVDTATSGFIAGAGAGYQFFRTSKVNLEVMLHTSALLGSNRLGVPTQTGLRIGLYW